MWWPWQTAQVPTKTAAHTNPEPDDVIQVYAEDDLLTRAEKIVWMSGWRGAVHGRVINVYRMLQTYERLDREAATVRTKAPEAATAKER